MQYFTNSIASTNWSKYGFYKYLLVANSCKEVYDKVVEEKKRFYYKCYEEVAITTTPDIIIAALLAKTEMELNVCYSIQSICNLYQAAAVILNNYGSFPSNTIFLNVQKQEPFKKLTKRLKAIDTILDTYNCPPIRLINSLPMSIARSLSKCTYYKAIKEYSQQTFFESFIMNERVLIKRLHQFHHCHQVSTFSLLPPLYLQIVAAKQLKLIL